MKRSALLPTLLIVGLCLFPAFGALANLGMALTSLHRREAKTMGDADRVLVAVHRENGRDPGWDLRSVKLGPHAPIQR